MARQKGKGQAQSESAVEWFEGLMQRSERPGFDFDRDVPGDALVEVWERLTGRRLTEDSFLEPADLWMQCEAAVREFREGNGSA